MNQRLVQSRVLLSFYWLVPLSIFIVLFDLFVLKGKMRGILPRNPESLLLFATFFNYPHIFASFFSFIDPEYLKHYKYKLFWLTLILVACIVVAPRVVGINICLILLSLWNFKHVVSQQLNLSRVIAGVPVNIFFKTWRWFGFLLVACWWVKNTLNPGLLAYANVVRYGDILPWVAGISFVFFGLSSFSVFRSSTGMVGRSYVLGNICLVITAVFFGYIGYPFFSILVFRVIHDATAFYFYSVHDDNRQRNRSSNYLYSFFKVTKIPVFWLCPVLGVLIAMPVSYNMIVWNGFTIAGVTVSISHFYLESIIWRFGGKHREYAVIA